MALTPSGYAKPFAAVGRDLFIKNFDMGGAMAQADLDALVRAVEMTSTITSIGAFTAGTSTGVNMIIEGRDVTAVTGYTVTNVAF